MGGYALDHATWEIQAVYMYARLSMGGGMSIHLASQTADFYGRKLICVMQMGLGES